MSSSVTKIRCIRVLFHTFCFNGASTLHSNQRGKEKHVLEKERPGLGNQGSRWNWGAR